MQTEKVNQHLIGKSYHDIVDHLVIDEDQGDCCGWASCETITSLPDTIDLSKLVLEDCVQISYDDNDMSRVVVNFVFTDNVSDTVILGYELSAGSGSGWGYGAYVSMKLDGEELAGASW